MRTIQQFRSFDWPVQVLLVNQLTINVGFFMLVPFLAGYLTRDLGFAAWMVGLVLGVRNLSQQGLFLVGGTLSDRIGYRPVIIAGCAVRTFGFAAFGIFNSLPGLLLAAVLTGLAGSLFNPAVRAYLAQAAGERRVDAFAMFNLFSQAGLLLGPLIGVALLGVDFRLVCVLAGGLFLVLTILQVLYLPAREGSEAHSTRTVLGDWREALANRAFILFALGTLGHFALFNQLYLGMTLEVRRVTGHDAGVGLVFLVSGVLGIVGQVAVTSYCKAHWRPVISIVIGLALMGLAFVPLFVAAPFVPLAPLAVPTAWLGAGGEALAAPLGQGVATTINLAPVLASSAVLTLGVMISLPFAMDLVATLGAGRMVGTYYGLYYLASGFGSAGGNLVVGAAMDVGQDLGLIGLPWLLLVLLGLASAASIAALDRWGLLGPASAEGRGRQPGVVA
ncbi:MAG: MFS transporter [Chloroflexi bacterium]|nr:MFS transporter [Chloroflexota bacterium]